jgi:hypothetical protein
VIIPVIRRRVTVKTSGVVDVPYRCEHCQLATLAHAQVHGTGIVTRAYISPSEDEARAVAYKHMDRAAREIVATCLCPRCGAPPASVVKAQQEFDAKNPGGVGRRKTGILIGGLGITALIAVSCIAAMLLAPTKGKTASDMVGVALCAATFLSLIGGTISLVVYMLVSPGKRPEIPTSNPSCLWFDPPRG